MTEPRRDDTEGPSPSQTAGPQADRDDAPELPAYTPMARTDNETPGDPKIETPPGTIPEQQTEA